MGPGCHSFIWDSETQLTSDVIFQECTCPLVKRGSIMTYVAIQVVSVKVSCISSFTLLVVHEVCAQLVAVSTIVTNSTIETDDLHPPHRWQRCHCLLPQQPRRLEGLEELVPRSGEDCEVTGPNLSLRPEARQHLALPTYLPSRSLHDLYALRYIQSELDGRFDGGASTVR